MTSPSHLLCYLKQRKCHSGCNSLVKIIYIYIYMCVCVCLIIIYVVDYEIYITLKMVSPDELRFYNRRATFMHNGHIYLSAWIALFTAFML
jgi:hypothetical protein